MLRFSSLLRFALCSLLTVLLTGCNTFTSKPELLPDCNVTCYISETLNPGDSVQLVVKVGSLQEQEHEQGFAHFIEHIAFNDTRDYPQEQLFARLRELGIEMGNHSNGMTHFDNTHYSLSLNNSHPENLDTALHILSQWAYHIQFNQAVIDAEKPVLQEEWRLEPELRDSVARQQFHHVLKGSRYAQRYPIGQPDIFMQARAEELRAFYQRWYRPDNFAVIVSGQVDKVTVTDLINKHFAPVKSSDHSITETYPSPESYPIDVSHYPEAHIINSTEISQHSLVLHYFIDFSRPVTSDEVFKEAQIKGVHQILNNRLQKRLKDTTGILTDIAVRWVPIGPNKASTSIHAVLSGDNTELATRVIAEEVNYLLVEGIQQQERDQWYQEQIQSFERPAHPGKTLQGAKAHFLYQTPLLSPADWHALFDHHEAQTRPAGMDQVARQLFQHTPHWEHLSPVQESVPDQQQLTLWLQGNTRHLGLKRSTGEQRHADNLWQIHPEITPRLLDSQTVADKTRQWQFANGMTVFHRYNGNVPGRFSFSLTAENGLNLLATDQQPLARSVMGILSASGMRELDAVELDQWLKKRKISLQSKMNFFSRELWGHARIEDFAEVMQLLHVILTEAEASDEATVRYQSKKLREYQRQVATPRQVLQRYLDRAQFNNHPALKAMDSDDLGSLNQNGLNRIYQTFLRGAQNYQLAIVGDIAETAAYPKIFSYIASLPASERRHRIEQSYPFPQKSETIDLTGNNSKATLLVARLALKKEQLSDYNYDQVMFMAYWVRQHLMQQLREQHGMTYDIHVHLEGHEALRPDFTLDISLNCDPEQVSAVRDALNTELDNMVSDPPSASHIKQWQKARYRELTDSFRNPVIQAAGLTRAQLSEYTPGQLLDVKARTQPPSGEELARMLARFISPEAVKTHVIWRARK